MKKTVYTLIIIFALTLCLGTVCHAARSEALIDENYEKLNTGVSLDTLEGWRLGGTTGGSFDSIFSSKKTVFDADDGNTFIRIAAGTADRWAQAHTRFIRDIPDKGEGLYEISYRVNHENVNTFLFDCFTLYGYVTGDDESTTTKPILYMTDGTTDATKIGRISPQFPKWDSGYYSTHGSDAVKLSPNTWYDVKYVVNTVANKSTVSIKESSASEWKSYEEQTIAPVDGLDYLLVRPGWISTASTMAFDDVKVLYSPAPKDTSALPVKAVLANETYDALSSDEIPVQALDGWSREAGYNYVFGVETAQDDGDADGKIMHIKPRSTSSWWNGAQSSYIRSVPGSGEGIYEISYRLNFGNMYSRFYDIFSVYAYPEGDAGTKAKSILNFFLIENSNKAYLQFAQSFDGSTPSKHYTTGAFAQNTWYVFFYRVNTVSNEVTLSYKKASDTAWEKTYTASVPDISALSYLKLRPGYHLEEGDTDHSDALEGTFSFDDLLITYDTYVDVVSTYPEQDAEGVDVWDTEVKLTFNMPMDESSLTPYSILVYKGGSPKPMGVDEYAVEVLSDKLGNTSASIRFAKPLSYATNYRVVVLADSVYTADLIRPEEDFTLEFTTRPLPSVRFGFFDASGNRVTNLADVAGKLIYIRMNISD